MFQVLVDLMANRNLTTEACLLRIGLQAPFAIARGLNNEVPR